MAMDLARRQETCKRYRGYQKGCTEKRGNPVIRSELLRPLLPPLKGSSVLTFAHSLGDWGPKLRAQPVTGKERAGCRKSHGACVLYDDANARPTHFEQKMHFGSRWIRDRTWFLILLVVSLPLCLVSPGYVHTGASILLTYGHNTDFQNSID